MKIPSTCQNCINPFCANLNEASQRKLFEARIWVNYSCNDDQPFFLENNQILIVEKGAIIGYRSTLESKLQSVTLIRPGDLLGMVSLFSSKYRESFCISALTESSGCMIPMSVMERLILNEPDICVATMRQFSNRYSRVVDNFMNKTLESSEQRVEYAMKQLEDIGIKHITHENLALLTGLHRVTVTKALCRLRQKGSDLNINY